MSFSISSLTTAAWTSLREAFDAGVHFREYIQKETIAVRVSKDHRAAIVGSPAYFKSRPKPKTQHDLLKYCCINFRHGTAGVYRWEFDKGKKVVISCGQRTPHRRRCGDPGSRCKLMGWALPSCQTSRWHRRSKVGNSSAC